MEVKNTTIALAIAALCCGVLSAALAGNAELLALGAVTMPTLLAAFGLWSRDRTSLRTCIWLGAFWAAFLCLLALGFYLHRPDEPLRLIGGFPAGTTILVYGMPPLGISFGLLYGVAFDAEILPEDKQREFLRRFQQR